MVSDILLVSWWWGWGGHVRAVKACPDNLTLRVRLSPLASPCSSPGSHWYHRRTAQGVWWAHATVSKNVPFCQEFLKQWLLWIVLIWIQQFHVKLLTILSMFHNPLAARCASMRIWPGWSPDFLSSVTNRSKFNINKIGWCKLLFIHSWFPDDVSS